MKQALALLVLFGALCVTNTAMADGGDDFGYGALGFILGATIGRPYPPPAAVYYPPPPVYYAPPPNVVVYQGYYVPERGNHEDEYQGWNHYQHYGHRHDD